MRRLIFNADDYGLSPGVCGAVRRAQVGVVHSTTVMANLVEPVDAAALAASGMSGGVHLNLSCGPSLTTDYPGELLDERGWFVKSRALDAATWEDAGHRRAAVREWAAQYDRLAGLGVAVTHADSHHHAHLLDALFPLALDFAAGRGLALRTRSAQRDTARSAGVPTPDGFVEDYFGYNKIDRAWLRTVLAETAGDVVEVMCHPGRVDPLLRERSGYLAERETELSVLSDTGLVAELEALGWRIVDYRTLLE